MFTLIITTALTLAEPTVPMPNPSDYIGMKVVEIDVPTEEAVSALLDAGIEGLACRPATGSGPWLIEQEDEGLLKTLGLKHADLVPNLAEFIANRNAERRTVRSSQPLGNDFYTDYRVISEYDAHIDQFLLDHADIATGIVIGQSHEGRDIRGIVINAGGGEKPAVLFNGTQHAREWISPPSTMYIADTLADLYGIDSTITALLDRVEVIVIPIVNPDGYAFTYEQGGDRYWRKNRRDNGGSCAGVDLNRNWGSDWNGGQSTSNDPCSDVYVGPSSMSEPEVQALANYCLNHGNIKAQIDYHAFSQLILEPRGYTTAPPPDWDELHALGGAMSDAIASVYGEYYVHDNPCNILYCASGTLIDWPYDTYGSKAYCVELRPSSGGLGGFDPPSSEILPCAQENFEGAMVLINDIATPLTISLPNGAPGVVSTEVETTFDVVIEARSEDPMEKTGLLHYRGDGGDFAEVSLSYQGENTYLATLPVFDCDEMPEYYISIMTHSASTVTFPLSAPAELLSANVITDEDIVFEDDGETNMGFTVSGNASDGAWELGVPVGGGVRGDPPTDADGSGSCWLTDNVEGNSDVDGGQTILTSPTIEIPENGWTLSYARWFSNNSGAAPGMDVLTVEWSEVGSSSWGALEVVGPTGEGTTGGWYDVSFDLDSVGLLNIDAFQFRVIADDAGDGSVIEAGLDAISLARFTCEDDTQCEGDVDGNDVVNVNDILNVIAVFGTNDPSGDANDDGIVNISDILLIINQWGEC
ncbi:MAG: hypothetical protein CMJ38_02930 [Phycisphaerae bacterium]|nr:hypothetical protein [Phycisphaerae bacterium]